MNVNMICDCCIQQKLVLPVQTFDIFKVKIKLPIQHLTQKIQGGGNYFHKWTQKVLNFLVCSGYGNIKPK